MRLLQFNLTTENYIFLDDIPYIPLENVIFFTFVGIFDVETQRILPKCWVSAPTPWCCVRWGSPWTSKRGSRGTSRSPATEPYPAWQSSKIREPTNNIWITWGIIRIQFLRGLKWLEYAENLHVADRWIRQHQSLGLAGELESILIISLWHMANLNADLKSFNHPNAENNETSFDTAT